VLQKEDYKPYPVQPSPPEQSAGLTLPSQKIQPPEDCHNFDIVRAAQYGVTERCIELVEAGFDVNVPDAENVTVLHWAAINNRAEIVRSVVNAISKILLVFYGHRGASSYKMQEPSILLICFMICSARIGV